MIIIGSYAAVLQGIRSDFEDIDLIASIEEANIFIERIHALISNIEHVSAHRIRLTLLPGNLCSKVEIDTEQSPSDLLLYSLCTQTAQLFNCEVLVSSPKHLYLIRKASIFIPHSYKKCIRDLLLYKPHIGDIESADILFYQERRKEVKLRFSTSRDKFSLTVSNDDFFAASNHIRRFVHDDIHRAIAYYPSSPLFERCKHDTSSAKIDRDLFLGMPLSDRLLMVQEEFIVIGIERFYIQDRSLTAHQLYLRGMHKTIRDLFAGFFQEFCVDHLDQLLTPPQYDYLSRFLAALGNDQIRTLAPDSCQYNNMLQQIRACIEQGDLTAARILCEDSIRSGKSLQSSSSFFYLGYILLRQKYSRDAIRCFERALSLGFDHPQIWLELGHAYHRQQKRAAASAMFHRAMRYPSTSKDAKKFFDSL